MVCRLNLGRGGSTWFVRGRSRFPPLRPLLNHRQSGPPERGGNPQNRKQPAKAFRVGPSGRPAPCCGVVQPAVRKCSSPAARWVSNRGQAFEGHRLRTPRGRRNDAADSRFPLKSRVSLGPEQSLARFAFGCGSAVQHTSSECFFRIKGEPNFRKSRQSCLSQQLAGSRLSQGQFGICRSCGFYGQIDSRTAVVRSAQGRVFCPPPSKFRAEVPHRRGAKGNALC